MMTEQTKPKSWYQVPFVWLVVAVPLSAVVMGGFLLYFSIVSFDGLVVDDYYKEGKKINRVLKRDKAALGHGLRAQVSFIDEKTLSVFLVSNDGYTPPPVLEVSFFNATRAGRDQAIFVEQQQQGIYTGTISDLGLGRWNVQIEADDWRLIGSLRTPGQVKATIEPAVRK